MFLNMDNQRQHAYPKGSFPVLVRVEGRSEKVDALMLLKEYMKHAGERYELTVVKEAEGNGTKAEAVVAVPFPDRENIRVDFNIHASEVEEHVGEQVYFHMESAFDIA